MHLLVVAISFPSPEFPLALPFIGEQVKALCNHVERITVLSPTTYVPSFMKGIPRVARQASLPSRYELVPGRCEVLFPRYIKAPGDFLQGCTVAHWRRIVRRTVNQFRESCPVSIIHANAGSVSSWASICVAKQFGLPCVITYQGGEVNQILAKQQTGWKLCRDSFRLADVNLCVSKQIENTLKEYAQPTGRCEVILRGVDQTRFFPSDALTDDASVLFVGRLQKEKGIFDLIHAWKEVKSLCPNAVLTAVGQDYSDGKAAKLANSLGSQAGIQLLGAVPPSGVARLMRQSRVFCLPSYAEGTPNVVMEAMSSGLPIVSTKVGGIPDIVKDQVRGLLVEPGDIEGLTDALSSLLINPSQSVRMGHAAHDFAKESLNIENTAKYLSDLYRQTLEEWKQ